MGPNWCCLVAGMQLLALLVPVSPADRPEASHANQSIVSDKRPNQVTLTGFHHETSHLRRPGQFYPGAHDTLGTSTSTSSTTTPSTSTSYTSTSYTCTSSTSSTSTSYTSTSYTCTSSTSTSYQPRPRDYSTTGLDKGDCVELRTKRFISDGSCNSARPVLDIICTDTCYVLRSLPDASQPKLKFEEWQCRKSATMRHKVKMICKDGSRRFYFVRLVTKCSCEKKQLTSRSKMSKQEQQMLRKFEGRIKLS